MKVSKETVDRLAELSRLEFSETEKDQIRNDLEKIVGFVEKLSELPVDNVEPLVYMSEEQNVTRADVPQQVMGLEEALKNAPRKDSDYIRVPKVLEKKD
ncbi:MAG: Asp-tRNA(Asn)/Glu-tRNA(Gln) amidotransferase subunit GatC [Bacteroidia bacterium]|nr:Asp-tRNA(Asn)/Glu-tRNA(Gln) amidotransferase subunit GatC [Bacteroidia bacterium]